MGASIPVRESSKCKAQGAGAELVLFKNKEARGLEERPLRECNRRCFQKGA